MCRAAAFVVLAAILGACSQGTSEPLAVTAPSASTIAPGSIDASNMTTPVAPTDPTTTADPIVELDATSLALVPAVPQVLATLPVGSGPGELGLEVCRECDPGRPWNPLIDSAGRVIVADAINHRWVVVENGSASEVPFSPNTDVVGVALGPADVVYALVIRGGDHRLEAYDSSALATPLMSEPSVAQTFGIISFAGGSVLVRTSGTQSYPLVRGESTAPNVSPDFLATPPRLTVRFADGHTDYWRLPADLSPILPVGLDNGSVFVTGSSSEETIGVELTADGRAAALVLTATNEAFNNSLSVDERGLVLLQLDAQRQTWTVVRYPLPISG